MSKTLVELAQEMQALDNGFAKTQQEAVADYQHKRKLISDDMTTALAQSALPTTLAAPASNGHVAPPTAKKKGGKSTAAASTGGKKKKASTGGAARGDGPTTKQHILSCLRRSRQGLDLRALSVEMTRLKNNGEWKTDADDIAGVLSQALNGMKKDRLVHSEKSPETNRNVYTATAAA